MKQGKLNLRGVKLLVKTVYAGRVTSTPMLSISKGNNLFLNSSFHRQFFPSTTKRLFVQLVCIKNVYYLLASATKKEHYFCLTRVSGREGTRSGFQSKLVGFSILAKKGVTMRYALTATPTTDTSIKAFALKHVVEDLVKSVESKEFQVG